MCWNWKAKFDKLKSQRRALGFSTGSGNTRVPGFDHSKYPNRVWNQKPGFFRAFLPEIRAFLPEIRVFLPQNPWFSGDFRNFKGVIILLGGKRAKDWDIILCRGFFIRDFFCLLLRLRKRPIIHEFWAWETLNILGWPYPIVHGFRAGLTLWNPNPKLF